MKVTIVCGPPGSGKSTLVRQQMCRGDLVVDMDALYQALSYRDDRDKPEELLPWVCTARDAVIEKLGHDKGPGQAWIITASFKDVLADALWFVWLDATVKILATSTAVCVQRMKNQGRTARDIQRMKASCVRWHGDYRHWREGRGKSLESGANA